MDIKSLFSSDNQFATGGLFLLAVGAVGAAFRNVPNLVWSWVLRQTTLTIVLVDTSPAFKWLKYWLDEQNKNFRAVDVSVLHNCGNYVLTPAPGYHAFTYKKRWVSLLFTRAETSNSYNNERIQTVTLRTFGRNKKFIGEFLNEIYASYNRHVSKPLLHFWREEQWAENSQWKPRPFETVFIPKTLKTSLVEDIKFFLNSQDWYKQKGIPYHRGYLFYGPPGTGKTSLAVGLSEKFNLPIYLLKISEHSDATLFKATTRIEKKVIVLLEDIDCAQSTAERTSDGKQEKDILSRKVTLSGLLNTLDGICTPEGVIFIMTTNYPERLDTALKRPGRVDMEIGLKEAGRSEKQQMFKSFFPDRECPAHLLNSTLTMAELQQTCLQMITRPGEKVLMVG